MSRSRTAESRGNSHERRRETLAAAIDQRLEYIRTSRLHRELLEPLPELVPAAKLRRVEYLVSELVCRFGDRLAWRLFDCALRAESVRSPVFWRKEGFKVRLPWNRAESWADFRSEDRNHLDELADFHSARELSDEQRIDAYLGPGFVEALRTRAARAAADRLHAPDHRAKNFAREVARKTWTEDQTERTGKVVAYIRAMLKADPEIRHPFAVKTVHGWIADLRPEAAKRGGRDRNDSSRR